METTMKKVEKKVELSKNVETDKHVKTIQELSDKFMAEFRRIAEQM